jgi:hypothetical protein
MIREFVIATAVAAAAVALAPTAAADPSNDLPDPSGRYASDVPGMDYDAHLAGPCDNYQLFTFGRGPGGEPLACHWIPNQWPPIYTGFWVASYPLYGQQDIGAPCPGPKSAAQSPDGRPMVCLGAQGWQPGTLTGAGFFPG